MGLRMYAALAVMLASVIIGFSSNPPVAKADDLFTFGRKILKKKILRKIEKQIGQAERTVRKSGRKGTRYARRSRSSRITTVAATSAPAFSMKDYEKLYDSYSAAAADQDRDVDAAIAEFIDKLKSEHEALWANAKTKAEVANLDEINSITEVDIRQSLDGAYIKNRLIAFDSFSGELWTRERLLVQVLREAKLRIEPYFDGIGAKGPSRQDVENVLSESAAAIYARAFEVNELLGLAQSFDRFSRTVYERTDETDLQLASSAQKFSAAEDYFETFVSHELSSTRRQQAEAIQKALMQSSPDESVVEQVDMADREFIVRYRARRVLFDCLDRGYAEIIGGPALPGGKATEVSLESNEGAVGAADTGGSAEATGRAVSSSSDVDLGTNVSTYMQSVCSPSIGELVNSEIAPIPARSQIAGVVARVDGHTIRTTTDVDAAQESE